MNEMMVLVGKEIIKPYLLLLVEKVSEKQVENFKVFDQLIYETLLFLLKREEEIFLIHK
jgi:hypothetical protein